MRDGIDGFAHDMRQSIPLSITFLLALIAFIFALLVATGAVLEVLTGIARAVG